MKTMDDYRLLAAEWACRWIGQERPSDEHTTTQWKCRRNHRWETSFSRFQGCRKCVANSPKVEADYHFLAQVKGLRWTGGDLPENTKTTTGWMCVIQEHEFESPYHNVRRGAGCPDCKTEEEE